MQRLEHIHLHSSTRCQNVRGEFALGDTPALIGFAADS
jgi:hypothetical protein